MFENLSLLELLLKGGYTMAVIGICSVVSLAVIIERYWYFIRKVKYRNDKEIMRFIGKIKEYINKNLYSELLNECENENTYFSRIIKKGFNNSTQKNKNEIKELLEKFLGYEILEMEKYTGILGTIGAVAPFIGLFGTVLGIMRAFHDLSVFTNAGPSVVSAGIAEALVTTAAGLLVAVPAVIFYNYFVRKIKRITKVTNILIQDILEELK